MRILIAPDKFKDSLGAKEVAQHIAAGLADVLPGSEIIVMPVGDGGEGTACAICTAKDGSWRECDVRNSLGELVRARYCTIDDGATAVMEMSEASGLWRVSEEKRNPITASSFGTGELLLAAAASKAKRVIVGLGGSATNDGGFGMARALGFRFLDSNEEELKGAVTDLLKLARIEKPDSLDLPAVIVASDVRNPLLGEQGATRVFGPQKGGTPEQLDSLEAALKQLADIVTKQFEIDVRDVPGAGAAGGLGFGLMTFCGARLRPGFQVVAEAIGLEAKMKNVDVVVTGEGSLDSQTLSGKAPAGVAGLARKLGKPVYAIVGRASGDPDAGKIFRGIYELMRPSMSKEECIKRAPELLRERARELAKILTTPNE